MVGASAAHGHGPERDISLRAKDREGAAVRASTGQTPPTQPVAPSGLSMNLTMSLTGRRRRLSLGARIVQRSGALPLVVARCREVTLVEIADPRLGWIGCRVLGELRATSSRARADEERRHR